MENVRDSSNRGDAAGRAPIGRLARLADTAFRRRRLVVAGWLVALVAAFGLLGPLAGEWSADYSTPGSDSQRAGELLAERFPGTSADTIDVVWTSEAGAASRAVGERIDGLLSRGERLEGIADAAPAAEAQVSQDGKIAVTRLPLTGKPESVPKETGEELIALAEHESRDGLRVELGGQPIAQAQESEVSSEMIGLAVAALILLLTFGTVVAAGLPIATALFGLGISSALIGLLAGVLDVPDWASPTAAMIGIGVGIDYALLIVTRFRAARAGGSDAHQAAVEAIATAGRSVLIAGSTVVISLMGLFLMGQSYLYGVALSAILAVLVVMAASVTLLPALLGFAGPRIDRLRIPGTNRAPHASRRTLATRWSRTVERRPLAAGAVALVLVAALALPATGLRLGFPDAGNDAAKTTTRQAYELTSQGFGAGASGPLVLVAELAEDDGRERLGALAERLSEEPGVAAVQDPAVNEAGDTAMVLVQPTTAPQHQATQDLIERLRERTLPDSGLEVVVGGATASFVDQSKATAERLPLFIGAVVVLSFLLLLVAFRSVVVPLKAGLMNLLSIGAAYGVVAYFADGSWAGELIGIETATPVAPFIPVIMFAVLFGLSMDYEVFLLSRIQEAYLKERDTSRAVTEGIVTTGRVVVAAAAIMFAVFGAFVASQEVFLKLIGLGLATAILVDALVVRMVLVPAVMHLLGERNWWLPAWLDRRLPRLDIEGTAPPAPRPAEA